jgi:hypothetical protein
MARLGKRLLVLALLGLLGACTSTPPQPLSTTTSSPSVTALPTAATPSPSPAIVVDCGPLGAADCAKAVAVLEGTVVGNRLFSSIRIQSPTPTMTCPPGGGPPPGVHDCDVVAVVATVGGGIAVSLRRQGDTWLCTCSIR